MTKSHALTSLSTRGTRQLPVGKRLAYAQKRPPSPRRRRKWLVRVLLLALFITAASAGTHHLVTVFNSQRTAYVEQIHNLEASTKSTLTGLATSHHDALIGWGDTLATQFDLREQKYIGAIDVANAFHLPTDAAESRLLTLAHERELARPAPLPPAATARLLNASHHPTFPLLFLDVSVRDERGDLVSGLAVKDFRVTDRRDRSHPVLATTVGTHLHHGLSLVVLIDCSNSTTGEPLAQAKAGTKQLVARLPERASLSVCSFGEQITVSAPWTDDMADISNAVDTITSAGNTPLLLALDAAITALESRPAPRAMLLFTDGRDTTGGPPIESLIARCNRVQVPVHAVSLQTQELDRALLERLSRETGGTHRSTNRIDELASQFEAIGRSLAEPVYHIAVNIGQDGPRPLQLCIGGQNSIGLSIPEGLPPARTMAP